MENLYKLWIQDTLLLLLLDIVFFIISISSALEDSGDILQDTE